MPTLSPISSLNNQSTLTSLLSIQLFEFHLLHLISISSAYLLTLSFSLSVTTIPYLVFIGLCCISCGFPVRALDFFCFLCVQSELIYRRIPAVSSSTCGQGFSREMSLLRNKTNIFVTPNGQTENRRNIEREKVGGKGGYRAV
jgi:hypothetical protein